MRRLLCCVLLLPALAMAEIYRWTDAQGRVHFSERPGAGAQPVEIKPQVIERDAQTREREAHTERFYQARRDERAQVSAQTADRQAQYQRQCLGLRRDLAQLSKGGRYYSRDAQGEPVFHSDEEIQSAQDRLSRRIAERCG
ncbi:MAG: DUF4124 domain-containing protein [Pseudomonadota bacterium]